MQVNLQAPVRRRLLLALGALALLDGCAHSGTTLWHGGPAMSDLPGDSHPEPSSSGPSPTASPSWQIPTPVVPTPGVCPTEPGVVQHPGGPQHYLPCSGTNIALTIDDGPDPQWTPQILALLARYQVPATFCMIGRHAAAYPQLVAAVVDGGHHVANHTFTHPIPISRLAAAQVHDEVNRASDAITAASGGHPPALFRSPGGCVDGASGPALGYRPAQVVGSPQDRYSSICAPAVTAVPGVGSVASTWSWGWLEVGR